MYGAVKYHANQSTSAATNEVPQDVDLSNAVLLRHHYNISPTRR